MSGCAPVIKTRGRVTKLEKKLAITARKVTQVKLLLLLLASKFLKIRNKPILGR